MKNKFYIESYGCAMNFSDSEIVASILNKEGYELSKNPEEANLILINTCSIRDKAEQTIRKRLKLFNKYKKNTNELKIGILGCMAERLKEKLLIEEKIVDLVVGPDSYRDLPNLIDNLKDDKKVINTILSLEETYDDIIPLRINSNGINAYISIMRGCDNMCSFCVVPFTRGRERSRNPFTIIEEANDLFRKGYREITLLGQNVDSYKWSKKINNKKKLEKNLDLKDGIISFANLLEMVAKISSDLRIRFSTSHPKDITKDVLKAIKSNENVCNYIHLPAQSGNSRILKMMNRTYDRDWYLNKVMDIKNILGNECGISSDFIAGFCSETEKEHQDTLSLMDEVIYDYSYMFYYSERPGTLAQRKYDDNITLETKKRRLSEIMNKQREHSLKRNNLSIGNRYKVLIEGNSKKSNDYFKGRTSENKMVIFPKRKSKNNLYVDVDIKSCNSATLFGEIG
ncbi:MAG TPA: tRNA (N6-isopentenyl adenosine(37)-C2)-methylthiotransferase MiaB [Cytophagales bacterium]|jgi:tRNA-2-methylthio-N6-dimethylallyladenosine synthase|nr:tRNA (N6-isopentenyl adenosine(37)-C2)-methylthiotransferase MiaB [Cytophagales bacterium]